MAKWIDYSIDERKALIAKVAQAKNIDDAAAEKDWWVTAVLYAVFHTSIAEYCLFKGGTSLSKGWDIISRFSEDYVDYGKELPDVIEFLPPASVQDAYRSDYNEMRGSFIYEKDPLSFDDLMKSVAAIQERFRSCRLRD